MTLRRLAVFTCVFLMASGVSKSTAQSTGFFSSWEDRASATLAQQPAWPIPLVTSSSGLIQVFRTDFLRQITPAGTDTWNYGNTKGINVVPWNKVEFEALFPPYIQHNSKAEDGFGDVALMLKYRVAAANKKGGNYSISFSVTGTMPTGSFKNGSITNTISPTVYAGKGFGKFDVQTTLGAILPANYTAKLGRPVVWNTVAQYRVGKYFWPEVESNATFYHGGPNEGRKQDFITPGLMLSKFKLERDPRNRLALIFGGGMQIAVTNFHTYNHGLVLTSRLVF